MGILMSAPPPYGRTTKLNVALLFGDVDMNDGSPIGGAVEEVLKYTVACTE